MSNLTNVLLAICCVLSCCGCSKSDLRGKYSTGMTKSEVLTQVGHPVAKQSFIKAGSPAVDNQYWQTIPDGVRVEVWEYRDHFGRHLLYFTNDSDSVAGVSFLSNGQPF